MDCKFTFVIQKLFNTDQQEMFMKHVFDLETPYLIGVIY